MRAPSPPERPLDLGMKTLVVQPDATDRAQLSSRLRDRGHAVTAVAGAEALEAVEARLARAEKRVGEVQDRARAEDELRRLQKAGGTIQLGVTVTTKGKQPAVVRAIVALAHELGISVLDESWADAAGTAS